MSDNMEAVKHSPSMELLTHRRDLENTIRLYERMFGTIVNGVYHDHCHSITYLKGRLDGLLMAMRVLDL